MVHTRCRCRSASPGPRVLPRRYSSAAVTSLRSLQPPTASPSPSGPRVKRGQPCVHCLALFIDDLCCRAGRHPVELGDTFYVAPSRGVPTGKNYSTSRFGKGINQIHYHYLNPKCLTLAENIVKCYLKKTHPGSWGLEIDRQSV